MNNIASLSAQQLRRAADLKDQIQSLQNELEKIVGTAAKAAVVAVPKKKFKMSAAARKKIAAAQKARWEKVKAAKK